MTNPNDSAYPDLNNRGLSKREYFAAMAMQGMLAGSAGLDIKTWEFAEQSIALADSLIMELNKKDGQS